MISVIALNIWLANQPWVWQVLCLIEFCCTRPQDALLGGGFMRVSLCLGVSFLALAFGCGNSRSQSFDPKPGMGPVVNSSDARGVSMASGRLYLSLPAISTAGLSRTGKVATNFISFDGIYHWAPFYDDHVGAVSNQNPFNQTDYNFFSYNGGTEIFRKNGTSSDYGSINYTTSDASGKNYVLKDGTVVRFEPIAQNVVSEGIFAHLGVVTKVAKLDGEIIEYKYWDPAGAGLYLKRVTSSLGWSINYDYSAQNSNYMSGKLYILNTTKDYCSTEAATSASPLNTCTISSSSKPPTLYHDVNFVNREFSVRDYDNNLIVNAKKDQITAPSGLATKLYYADGRIERVQIGSSTWRYNYNTDPLNFGTTVTDPRGKVSTTKTETVLGRVTQVTDETGRVTKYSYNGLGLIENVMPPETVFSGTTPIRGHTHYNYDDGNRNVTSIVQYSKDSADTLTTSYGYESYCVTSNGCYNKVTSITDPKGQVTTYTYSHVHGGVETETRPAPDTNSPTPQTRYTYKDYKPKIKNASGAIVESPTVWRVSKISTCASSTNSCEDTADETKTIFEYDLDNNLLLKSMTVAAGNAVLSAPPSETNIYAKTTYTYNYTGLVTSIDGPRQDVDDVVYFTYDNRYRPVFEIGIDPDGGGPLKRAIIRHRYDVDGNEQYTDKGIGNATDGSDFDIQSYVENVFDSSHGKMTRSKVVVVTQP